MRRNEALYGAVKAEVRRLMARDGVSGRTFEQLVLEAIAMDEEEYLSKAGYPKGAMPHATFTRSTMNVSDRALRGYKKEHGQKLKAWTDARDRLRAEYRTKVQAGELEPRGRMARMMGKAKGHPDNSSVQAARRVLKKHGFWTDQMSRAADERHEAVTTASMGSIGKDTRNLILANDYDDDERKL